MIKTAIQPTRQQLEIWIQAFVPDKDLFFITEEEVADLKESLAGTLLFPRQEFFNHSSYKGVQMVSSYMYWTVSNKVDYVIVAEPQWITALDAEQKEFLLSRQAEFCAGLTIPLSELQNYELIPQDYIVQHDNEPVVIIRRAMWEMLPLEVKQEMISITGQRYDAWEGKPVPASLPDHLRKYANSFAETSGANCLAADLYAISTKPDVEEWIIHEWVQQETFALQLQRESFVKSDGRVKAEDVVVWVDEEDVIQHAAYCIDGELFFNKNGQIFTNPWKLVDWAELEEGWRRFTPVVYRKISI